MDEKKFVILKFGGTSVSTKSRWQTIGKIIQERLKKGERPIVVCSAVTGVTNTLEALLKAALAGSFQDEFLVLKERHKKLALELAVWNRELEDSLEENFKDMESLLLGISLIKEIVPRIQARIVANGELLSTKLGARFLSTMGIEAVWYDMRQHLTAVSPPSNTPWREYLSAHCDSKADESMRKKFSGEKAKVIVTQGFIASNSRGETVLLGRGGSDTSASYLAAKLSAIRCEIWTDVPGMYTANPRQIPSARLLKKLHYIEAQEIASMGAKVLHPKCISPLIPANIPLHIYCTDRPEAVGTVISQIDRGQKAQVKGVSVKNGITLVSVETIGMWQEVGFLAHLFQRFKKHGLSIDLLSTSETNVTVSLDPLANSYDPAILRELQKDLERFGEVQILGPCSVISLVGQSIRSILHKLAPVFKVFEEKKVYMVSQAASDLNLTFVVNEEEAGPILQQIHVLLFDHLIPDDVFGPTWQEVFETKDGASNGGRAVTPWWMKEKAKLLAMAAKKSPLYVYNRKTLEENYRALRGIEGVGNLFYALKANSHPEILKIFYELGSGLECVSPGEFQMVQENCKGISPKRILFTPNFARREEYAEAFKGGFHVTVDNVYPLEKWTDIFRGREILLRLDPGRGRGHHDYVHTGGEQSKFGISYEELDRVCDLVKKNDIHVVGLHSHAGSGITVPEHWKEVALFLLGTAERFPECRYLNLGGGLAIPYRPNDLPLDLQALGETLVQVKKAYSKYEFWLEPGRFMVATAGVLLSSVTQLKTKGHTHYVGIDTGMNSLIRPALYGAYHDIVNLTHMEEAPVMTANVVGPICESGDTLGYSRRLPKTAEGDVLLIDCVGAYGRVMSSQYNLRLPAEESFL